MLRRGGIVYLGCHRGGGTGTAGRRSNAGLGGIGSSLQSFDYNGNESDMGDSDGGIEEDDDSDHGGGAYAFDQSTLSGFGDDALTYDALDSSSSSSSDDDFEPAAEPPPPLPAKSTPKTGGGGGGGGGRASASAGSRSRINTNKAYASVAGGDGLKKGKIAGRIAGRTKKAKASQPPALPAKKEASSKGEQNDETFDGFGGSDMYIDIADDAGAAPAPPPPPKKTKSANKNPAKCARGHDSGGRACYKAVAGSRLYCANHSCTHKGCQKSKSSSDKYCANHLPSGIRPRAPTGTAASEYIDVVGDLDDGGGGEVFGGFDDVINDDEEGEVDGGGRGSSSDDDDDSDDDDSSDDDDDSSVDEAVGTML